MVSTGNLARRLDYVTLYGAHISHPCNAVAIALMFKKVPFQLKEPPGADLKGSPLPAFPTIEKPNQTFKTRQHDLFQKPWLQSSAYRYYWYADEGGPTNILHDCQRILARCAWKS